MKPWIALVALAACHGNVAGGSNNGAEIFAMACSTCHGPKGQPSADMVARLNVRDLTSPEFRKRVTPELVDNQVRMGSKNKLMPAFNGALSNAQILAVAEYVASAQFSKP